MRLGFAICAPHIADQLTAKLGPWAVSGPALWAGTHALNDTGWATDTRTRLKADAVRLDALLVRAGMTIVGGTDLFRLAACDGTACDGAEGIYEKLGRAGILTRPFTYNATWLRFGLPGCEADWARLETALGL